MNDPDQGKASLLADILDDTGIGNTMARSAAAYARRRRLVRHAAIASFCLAITTVFLARQFPNERAR